MIDQQPAFTFGKPRRFTLLAVLALNAFGLLLGLPILFAVIWVSFQPLSIVTYLLPLGTMGLAVWFLPFGIGNGVARRLAPENKPAQKNKQWLVQLSATPRLRSGLRAMLEDADDLGWCELESGVLRFNGDSIQLVLTREQVRRVSSTNIGYRGLFIYGAKVVVEISGIQGLQSIELAERSSLALPRSRRRSRELCEAIKAALT